MNWICSHCGEKFSRYRTRCSADGQRVIEDLSGQLIGGRYRVRELIGVGGMDSTVWKAWQTGTERVVAVKVLPAPEEAAAKRFARGARIAANLNHPNCTVVHDYGQTEDGKLFLVMEFLAGQVLQELLGPEGMAAPDAIHIAIQVLQALEHAHSERAVHRDLKPDNLFLIRKNDDPLHVKILDFGIAKYVEEDPEATSSTEDDKSADDFEDLVTEQRQVCGTPQYMAPEQVVGARIDGRTDLYALGCVLYRMLTGRLPFDGKTRYELYQKHLQEVPKPFHEVRPDLVFPDRLELIVMKALSKRPDLRFQGASEMRKALESVEVAGDRQRRGTRPRVALKNTSPQERGSAFSPDLRSLGALSGGAPTILPGPAWTLSQPAPVLPEPAPDGPPPLPFSSGRAPTGSTLLLPETSPRGARPQSQSALPSVVPSDSLVEAVSYPAPPSLPGSEARSVGRPETQRGARPTDAQARSARSKGLPDTQRSPRPSLEVQAAAQARAVREAEEAQREGAESEGDPFEAAPRRDAELRVSTNLLNDAVVRHPASRSSLVAGPEVPRSTETEPNRAGQEGEHRRRRWTIFAVLAGAFLLGVGGVALVMRLTQSDDVEGPERTAGGVQVEREASGQGARQVVAAAEAGASKPSVTPPTAPTAVPSEVPSDVPTRAGQVVGEALADAPMGPSAPAKAKIAIDSTPSGATVREGAEVLGTTPLSTALDLGHHRFSIERVGHVTATLEVDLSALDAIVTKAIVLVPEPRTNERPSIPGTTPRGPGSFGNPRPAELPYDVPALLPKVEVPAQKPEVKEDPKPKGPQVKLLEEGGGSKPAVDPGKKPTVKLLEDDEPQPKKPQVKVLDE
ncbi:MAG: protein kinase [Deltaproteobacteria bacterium]|nr:protein kinase [Deltaproteobacteria bacterium]